MNDSKVRSGLIQSAVAFFAAQSIQTDDELFENLPVVIPANIAWENKTFDTSNKPFWASVYYQPNKPEVRTIGEKGYDEITGFLQIDFNIPKDSGEGNLPLWENKMRLFYHVGRVFSYDSQSVIVTSAGMSQGRHVDSFYRKSATIYFKSQLKRPKLTN